MRQRKCGHTEDDIGDDDGNFWRENSRLRCWLVAAALIAGVIAATAQGAADYPSSPVKIIVPFAPGGATDVVTRIFADVLSARWGGKSIIVESRPGAGTVIGANAIAKAAPDGYTIGMIVGSFMTNAAISPTLALRQRKGFYPARHDRDAADGAGRQQGLPGQHARRTDRACKASAAADPVHLARSARLRSSRRRTA